MAPDAVRPAAPPRVCVVGAGFAGLAAAWTLQRGGAEVVLLEARDRVGGRVRSQPLPNGAVAELGAEFVEHDQQVLAATAAALGVPLVPAGMSYGDREPRGGRVVSRATLRAEVARLGRLVAERRARLPAMSVAALLNELPLDPGARDAIAARIQISAAQPLDQLAATSLEHAGSTFDTRESLRVAGGNQRLALALASRIGKAVRLGTPVEAVSWSEAQARIRAAGGTVEADACVLTVPVSVMEAITFDPPLPGWKQTAFDRVAYGHAAKLHVPLCEPAPPSAVMSVPDRYWTYTARGAGGEVQPLVSAFAGSAPALAELRVAAGPAAWLERLRRLRPDLAMDAAGAVLATWDDDPWARAAYSTRVPGWHREDDELLARPIGPLHFAGEHTAGEWAGLMEGALRSGERAAREVLARVRAREARGA
jgi:monoamine oxidase